ncbi:MAG: protease HtpX [Oligoflexales bacterium]|nr:protease HtpX [Oligoflexales bacterium]
MFRRIFLFVLTNILVLATITIIAKVLGLETYYTAQGLNYESLMVWCALWGFGGAFISLLMSKFMAKMAMRVKIIDPQNPTGEGQRILDMTYRLARAAGLSKMPEVGIYDNPEINAFATGPSRNNSLVAVSTGLIRSMDRNEIEGVIGHEIAHIANGDMVTMTLIQGVINAFVLFFAKIAAWAVANFMRSSNDESPSYMLMFGLEIAFQIVFGILGSVVVAYFSRIREFRADKGGATFAGRGNMIAALQALQRTYNPKLADTGHPEMATMKINAGGKMMALFTTHPPLEQRILRLQQMV